VKLAPVVVMSERRLIMCHRIKCIVSYSVKGYTW